jgi:hypothetical protein
MSAWWAHEIWEGRHQLYLIKDPEIMYDAWKTENFESFFEGEMGVKSAAKNNGRMNSVFAFRFENDN